MLLAQGGNATATQPRRLLTGGRLVLPDGTIRDADMLVNSDGRIADIAPMLTAGGAVERIDLGGRLVSPGLVDMHQHLDKTGVLRFTPNPSGTLQGAREAFAKYARNAPPDDVARRAERTMARCLSRGTTAIRSHVNVDKDAGFNGIDALVQLRSDWFDRMRLQLVAFMTPHPGQDLDWLERNIDRAVERADAVGGTPAVAEDPYRYMDILFAAAERHGKPVDLHLDEHLDTGRPLFDAVFERVRRFGLEGRTVLGHASVLSALPQREFERIRDEIAALELGVVTLPAANLYLQGRDHDVLPPRGLTRVAQLIRSGVAIATASDNIQDPFVPTGSGDMLEIGRWTLLAGHLRGDELSTVYEMMTRIPARLMKLDGYGIEVGARADLIVTDCADVDTLVAAGGDHVSVFVGGRPVFETTTSTATDWAVGADHHEA